MGRPGYARAPRGFPVLAEKGAFFEAQQRRPPQQAMATSMHTQAVKYSTARAT